LAERQRSKCGTGDATAHGCGDTATVPGPGCADAADCPWSSPPAAWPRNVVAAYPGPTLARAPPARNDARSRRRRTSGSLRGGPEHDGSQHAMGAAGPGCDGVLSGDGTRAGQALGSTALDGSGRRADG